jgi:hypothetical protein
MKVITSVVWIAMIGYAITFFYPDISLVSFKNRKADLSQTSVNICTQETFDCPDGSTVKRDGPNCTFAICPISNATTSDITLSLGETKDTSGIRITFNSFIGDSRCPSDVKCIQAGKVTINITITDGKSSATLDVSSDEPYFIFATRRISLIEALPKPISNQQIKSAHYHVTFHVEE